jgi:hypothetical protein
VSVFEQIARVARPQHGCVALAQLRQLGIHDSSIRRLVRRGFLSRLGTGVFAVVGAPPTWERDVMAAVMAGGPQAVASHRTAAALWRLGPSRPGVIEVVSPRGERLTSGSIRRHETLDLPGRDRGRVDGIALTSPTRTLIDMGRFAGTSRLGSMVDDAVRRNLTSYECLGERLRELARRGRPGIVTVREVLRDRPGGAPPPGSDFETMTRRALVEAGLPAPVAQHPVVCGEYRFLLDLAWPDQRVGLECEGFRYHSTPDQLAWDDFRRNQLVLAGWQMLAYTWGRMRNDRRGVVDEVRRALGHR